MQNCFNLQTFPTEHLSRTQLLLKLHWSFNHKKPTGCVSPILPYITLRLILHLAPCCAKTGEVCFRTAPQEPSWLNKHTGISCCTKVCSHTHTSAAIFWTFIQRQVSLHSFPLMLH